MTYARSPIQFKHPGSEHLVLPSRINPLLQRRLLRIQCAGKAPVPEAEPGKHLPVQAILDSALSRRKHGFESRRARHKFQWLSLDVPVGGPPIRQMYGTDVHGPL
jgi:hypothetical protein